MRDQLYLLVQKSISGVELLGHPLQTLPNTLNFIFEETDGESIMIALDMQGIAVSTGTACSSGSPLPSHVLSSMGIPLNKINNSLRISLGWSNTPDQIEKFCKSLALIIQQIREKTRTFVTY